MRIPSGILVAVLLAFAILAGCSQSTTPSEKASTDSSAILSDGVLTEAIDDQPKPIGQVKQSAQPGDIVVIRGYVGGRTHLFVDGRAVMTIVDVSEPTICLADDDHCPTPWDYCCTPQDQLLAQTATVQVVDEQGLPIRTNLQDAGIKPMQQVTVRGEVVRVHPGRELLISALAIHPGPMPTPSSHAGHGPNGRE